MTEVDGEPPTDGQRAGSESTPSSWRCVGASMCGTSHQTSAIPCQDAHYWQVGAGDMLIAAVADGAGSAELAEVGAAVASKSAVAAFYANGQVSGDDKGIRSSLNDALKEAQKAVKAEATARKVEVRQLATTLILVVATPELVGAAQVGDGIAVVQDRDGNITGLTTPAGGEHVNETTFLNSRRDLKHAQFSVWRGALTHVAILSDGLQRLALNMPSGVPHTPFFAPLFKFVSNTPESTQAQQQLQMFLASPRVTDNTTDDLTLVLFGLVP